MPFFFHAGQARRLTLRVSLVLAAAVPAASLHAQTAASGSASVDSVARPDTVTRSRGQMLTSVVITAERRAPTLAEEGVIGRILRVDREHRQVVDLLADNRKLRAHLNEQGREIARLETRLTWLKTTVTDSIQHQIATARSATESVRARRLALEAQLAEMETPQLARRVADSPPALLPPREGAAGTR